MVGYRDGDGSDPMDDATLQRQLQDRLEYVKNHLIIKVRGLGYRSVVPQTRAKSNYVQFVLSLFLLHIFFIPSL